MFLLLMLLILLVFLLLLMLKATGAMLWIGSALASVMMRARAVMLVVSVVTSGMRRLRERWRGWRRAARKRRGGRRYSRKICRRRRRRNLRGGRSL